MECTFFLCYCWGRSVDSNMNDFSCFYSNLFAILVYYLKVGDVSSLGVVGNAVFVNYIGDFTLFSKHLLDSPM